MRTHRNFIHGPSTGKKSATVSTTIARREPEEGKKIKRLASLSNFFLFSFFFFYTARKLKRRRLYKIQTRSPRMELKLTFPSHVSFPRIHFRAFPPSPLSSREHRVKNLSNPEHVSELFINFDESSFFQR